MAKFHNDLKDAFEVSSSTSKEAAECNLRLIFKTMMTCKTYTNICSSKLEESEDCDQDAGEENDTSKMYESDDDVPLFTFRKESISLVTQPLSIRKQNSHFYKEKTILTDSKKRVQASSRFGLIF